MSLAQCWKNSSCLVYVGLEALIFFLGKMAVQPCRNAAFWLQSHLKQQSCTDLLSWPLDNGSSAVSFTRSFCVCHPQAPVKALLFVDLTL